MIHVKKYITAIILSTIITSCIWAGVFIYTSTNRTEEYTAKYNQLRETNKLLREYAVEREEAYSRIQQHYTLLGIRNRELENYAKERERIISETRNIIGATKGSIYKLESILLAIQKLEQIWLSANSD